MFPIVGPVRRWPSGRGRAAALTSHSRIVPSLLPLASMRPSPLNATGTSEPVLKPVPGASRKDSGVFSVFSSREDSSDVRCIR